MLNQLLKSYCSTTSPEVSVGLAACSSEKPTDLPASILMWPAAWRLRFDTVASLTTRLLPIEALYAEAAAEIAVRCEYSLQNGQGQAS